MNPNPNYRKSTIPENAKRVFEGEIFDVYQWEQELYDGSKAIFEKLTRPDGAFVYAVLADGRVLLVEDTQPGRDMVLCAPGGRIESGETPEEGAKRELMEETGYSVESLELLYPRQPLSKIDWMQYVFIGKGAKKTGEPHLDGGEKVVPRIVSFDELIALAISEELDDERLTILVLAAKADVSKMAELKKKFAN